MATSNLSLLDEFEEAFQSCLNILTKEEAVTSLEKEDVTVDVDPTVLKLLDLARQLEAFFLQKRFLLSALKPESIVKEDITDLKTEIQRKEELIKRHQEKINTWQTLLADLQVQNWAKSPAQSTPPNPPGGPVPAPSVTPTQAPMTASLQQLQQQQQQQQMHQMQIQQQMQPMPPQQAMFMQQQGAQRFPVPGPGPGRGRGRGRGRGASRGRGSEISYPSSP